MKKFLIINFVAMLFACNISMKAVEAEVENIEPNASKENKTSYPSAQARATFGQKPQNTSNPLKSPVEKPTTANLVNKPANEGGIAIPKSAVSKEPVRVKNSDGSTTERVIHPDGIIEETTHRTDDSVYNKKINLDGSIDELTIHADNSLIEKTTNASSVIETVTGPNGEFIQKLETTTYPDGKTVEKTDADTNIFEAYDKLNKKISEIVIKNGNKITTEYNPETGKIKQKTTVKKDGTKIVETSNPADKSRTKITTKLDGTRTEKITDVDGSSREITTMKNGTKKETITDVDGSAHVTTTDVNGQKSEPTFHYADNATDKDIDPATFIPTEKDLDDFDKNVLTPQTVLIAKQKLGLDLSSDQLTEDAINKKSKVLLFKYHPDKNKSNPAATSTLFKEVGNAKALLLRRVSA